MSEILVVTVNEVAGARISRVIGPVFGTSVRSLWKGTPTPAPPRRGLALLGLREDFGTLQLVR